MNRLVQLGIISRPHGFRGEFVVKTDTGLSSVLDELDTVFVGRSEADARSFVVKETAWMPKGWKVALEGVESEEAAKGLRGQAVFTNRTALPSTVDNEYYVSDLVGAEVHDADSGTLLGKFVGIETAGGLDWWIVRGEGVELTVPPRSRYVRSVDLTAKRILLANVDELR